MVSPPLCIMRNRPTTDPGSEAYVFRTMILAFTITNIIVTVRQFCVENHAISMLLLRDKSMTS